MLLVYLKHQHSLLSNTFRSHNDSEAYLCCKGFEPRPFQKSAIEFQLKAAESKTNEKQTETITSCDTVVRSIVKLMQDFATLTDGN